MAKAKKVKTDWSQLASAWMAKGNAPTQEMIDAGLAKSVPNDPTQPFLTGGQTVDRTQAQLSHDQQVQDLQDQLATATLNAGYQKKAIEQSRGKGVSGTQDDAAARGIFQSSIKDGQIYDINAQAANQQQQLSDQLTALTTSVTSRINLLDQALVNINNGYNQMSTENASQIDSGSHYEPAGAAAAPAPSGGQPAAAKSGYYGRPQWRSKAFGGYVSPTRKRSY